MGNDFDSDKKQHSSNANANNVGEGESEGGESLMPPLLFSSSGGEDTEGLGSDRETAEDMLDGMGGYEYVDDLFGGGFAVDYEDTLADFYKNDSASDTALQTFFMPADDQDRLKEQKKGASSINDSLSTLVFDVCDRGESTEQEVEEARAMLDEFSIRVELVGLWVDLYALLNSVGILNILKVIISIIQKTGTLKIEQQLRDLENDLIKEKNRLAAAKKDLNFARIELVLDASLAAIGIGAVLAGASIPGLNLILLAAGLAGGYMLKREEESGIPSMGSVGHLKISHNAATTAMKHFEKGNVVPKNLSPEVTKQLASAEGAIDGAAKNLKFTAVIGAGLNVYDVYKDAEDVWDEEEQLANVMESHREWYQSYLLEKATLLAEQMEAQAKVNAQVEKIVKSLDGVDEKIASINSEISTCYNILDGL